MPVGEDRDLVLEAVLEGTTAAERTRLAVLHHWLALRWVADAALVPRRHRHAGTDHPAVLRHALDRLGEARRNASAWTRTEALR